MELNILESNAELKFFSEAKGSDSFITCGMFTETHIHFAKRLVESLNKFKMPHAVYLVPDIHASISPKGRLDSEFNKPNFIKNCIKAHNQNILYIDVDCVIQEYPALISDFEKEKVDFAILNWLKLEDNQCFTPVKSLDGYYMFSNSIDFLSDEQLICSGAVQYWAKTNESISLLHSWQEIVILNPNVQDDWSLDYTFNNKCSSDHAKLKTEWLEKKYCRYAWWIFDKPIINHPDIPFSGARSEEIVDKEGRQRVNVKYLFRKKMQRLLRENEIIDTNRKLIIDVNGDVPFVSRALNNQFWL